MTDRPVVTTDPLQPSTSFDDTTAEVHAAVVTTDPLQPSTSFVENVPSFCELIPTPVGLSASSRATTRKRRVGHACVFSRGGGHVPPLAHACGRP